MIRKHYTDLFNNDALQCKSESVAKQTYGLTEFLVHVLKIKFEDLGNPIKVKWHTSCHEKREMEIGAAPKELLRQLKDVELLELEREDECSRFG